MGVHDVLARLLVEIATLVSRQLDVITGALSTNVHGRAWEFRFDILVDTALASCEGENEYN